MKRIAFTLFVIFFSQFVNSQIANLDIKVFLEGSNISVTSSTTYLNDLGYLPLCQPYNTSPWYYSGDETVSNIPNSSVVDWILVEVRRSTGDVSTAIPDSTVAMKAGFLSINGKITGLDGITPLKIYFPGQGNYYVVIWHRNHIGVISNYPLIQNQSGFSYDFTTSADKAYGDTLVMKSNGYWWLVRAGDGFNDLNINNQDKNESWVEELDSSGYYSGDFRMNGTVDNSDINLWKSNCGKSGIVPGGPRMYWTNEFSCGELLKDYRDGHVYTTVQIGTQCWMAENLNYGIMINGVDEQAFNTTIEKYCYSNIENNCDIYGGLYQWDEMMQYTDIEGSQGICPDGWYVPTDHDWCKLENIADINIIDCFTVGWKGTDAGGNLKETGLFHWLSPNTGATNNTGFTGLPGGHRSISGGTFYLINSNSHWWSSSTSGNDLAWGHTLKYDHQDVYRIDQSKDFGFSLRCIKRLGNQPPATPINPSPLNGSIGNPINLELSWICSDPENDKLTYDVYLGTGFPLTLISEGDSATHVNPESILSIGSNYYWRVIAFDENGNSTTGPIWNFTVQSVVPSLDLVEVAGGTFEVNGVDVTLDTFNLGQYEVTFAQYIDFLNDIQCEPNGMYHDPEYGYIRYLWVLGSMQHNGTDFYFVPGDKAENENCPVFYVTWFGANAYCHWAGGRLPSAVEWEVAARGGTTAVSGGSYNDNWAGTNTESELYNYAWYGESSQTGKTHPVGLKLPNELSIYDMSGNVGEWCYDWAGYEYPSDTNNPTGSASGIYRVHRGGYFLSSSYGCKVSVLGSNFPSGGGYHIGFRVADVKNLPPEKPSNPAPQNGAVQQPVNTILSWSCSDPENNPLTYDVYFGETNPPQLVSAGQSDTTYYPGNLNESEIYYWKVIAHDNHNNTTEGNLWNFITVINWSSCGSLFTDPRDGQTYTTVQIGDQCWMAENINVGTMVTGYDSPSDNNIIEKFCYDDDTANCNVYGGLYNLNETLQYSLQEGIRGVCPPGWHVPTDSEVCTMGQELVSDINCSSTGSISPTLGGLLKEAGYEHWESPNTGATNSSGFTALPAGVATQSGFLYQGQSFYFWSSTFYDSLFVYVYNLSYNTAIVGRAMSSSGIYSVRCLKDD